MASIIYVSSSLPGHKMTRFQIASTWFTKTKKYMATNKIVMADPTHMTPCESSCLPICMVAIVKPTLGNMNAHQFSAKWMAFSRDTNGTDTKRFAMTEMQKNQKDRLQMNTAATVESVSSTCFATTPCSPPKEGVLLVGQAFESPIMASAVKLGGPTAMNIAG